MSDGDKKLSYLVSKAKEFRKGAGSSDRSVEDQSYEDDFSLGDVHDPARLQPSSLDATEHVDPDPFEVQGEAAADEGAKPKGIAGLSMGKKLILLGVAGVGVFGFQQMKSPTELPATPPAQQVEYTAEQGTTQQSPSEAETDVFTQLKQMPQRNENIIDVTGRDVPAELTAAGESLSSTDDLPMNEDLAFDLSPPGESLPAPAAAASPAFASQPGASPDLQTTGDSSMSEFTDPSAEDLMAAQESMTTSGAALSEADRENIVTVRNQVEDLSQSVTSIEERVLESLSSNRELTRQVSQLMSELRRKNSELASFEGRPNITDLVIFTAASNCSECVPHAVFSWNQQQHEVGDGLRWNDFDASITGDRLTLAKDGEYFHYWYR